MTPRVLHRAAGLILAAPCPLPGFVPLDWDSAADITYIPDTCPPWATPHQLQHAHAPDPTPAGTPAVSRATDGVFVAYSDGTGFWIASDAATIWSLSPPSATLADTCTYLASSVLGLTLRMRGALALHASAVTIAGHAYGFIGPHGAGKSTIAAALARRGHAIICDDLLHLRREPAGWFAQPYPGIVRLWPDATPLVCDADANLPPITNGWDKRFLSPAQDGLPVAEAPVPLGGLALLQPRVAGPPSLDDLPAAAALIALVSNSAAAQLLDRGMRTREFEALSALVAGVRCARATASQDGAQLAEFVRAIESWAL